MKALETVYLVDNPMAASMGNAYHQSLKAAVPSLEQIDGSMLKQLFSIKQSTIQNVVSITKKDIDPKAKKILEDVIMRNS